MTTVAGREVGADRAIRAGRGAVRLPAGNVVNRRALDRLPGSSDLVVDPGRPIGSPNRGPWSRGLASRSDGSSRTSAPRPGRPRNRLPPAGVGQAATIYQTEGLAIECEPEADRPNSL
jgi:hypothetical protein